MQESEYLVQGANRLIRYTSPSEEKLRADITVVTDVSGPPKSKLGSPGGPLASKTLIFVTLQRETKVQQIETIVNFLVIPHRS